MSPLRGQKPRPGYISDPQSIGEHLKMKRMDLGLLQKDAAGEIGVNVRTYENWETGKFGPEDRFFPGIIRFLGYDPSPEPRTLAERIRATRRRQGISQKELARRLGLDPTTVQAWETGQVRQPWPRYARLFEEYVAGSS